MKKYIKVDLIASASRHTENNTVYFIEHERGNFDADFLDEIESDGMRPIVLKIHSHVVFGETYFYAIDRNEIELTSFGGTFVYVNDSRFRKISQYPIPLHDFIEK